MILHGWLRQDKAAPLTRNSLGNLEEKGFAYQPLLTQSPARSEAADDTASDAPLETFLSHRLSKRFILPILFCVITIFAAVGIGSIIAYSLGLFHYMPSYDAKSINSAGRTRHAVSFDRMNSSYSNSLESNFVLHDFETEEESINDLELLILCPMRNAEKDLPHFFEQLERQTHPRQRTTLGFLVGDEEDDTAHVLTSWAERMQAKGEGEQFRKISIVRKDFNMDLPRGNARHKFWVQTSRRAIMAKARTYLLTAMLEPAIDWVLWIDSDIEEYSPTIFKDLLLLGNAGVNPSKHLQTKLGIQSTSPDRWNDVIVPNAMRRGSDGSLRTYDMNNWAETDKSRDKKAKLFDDTVLVEGSFLQKMGRKHLVHDYQPYTQVPQVFSLDQAELDTPDIRLDSSSEFYIGRQMKLDGIGGVAALVRADIHRLGAVFPSWVVDHQLETEGFGRMADRIGANMIGLSNYFVLHH